MSNHEFGDSANKPREIDQDVLDELERERKERARARKHYAATQPWANERIQAIEDLRCYWYGWCHSSLVPKNEKGNPKPWLGYCPGAENNWPTIWNRAQVCRVLDPEEFTLNWYPFKSKKHISHQSKTVSFTFQPNVAEYSEFHKTKWYSEETARSKDKCNVMLHMTCPSWCPNCGACGVRPTFPGCGREPLPQPEEDKLRSVVEQLVEMRPPIREAAKARAHANGKLEDAKKALKAAENALEAASAAFFPIFNGKLTKAVATAKKGCEIYSKASESASNKYDEESDKYLRVFEQNMDVFPKKNLKRFAPPGYRF